MTTSTECACTATSACVCRSRPARATNARGRVAAGILALTLALAAVTASVTTSSAAETPTTVAGAAAVRIALARTPAAVAPGENFSLVLRLNGPTTNLILRVSVHSAITSRTAFADTIAGGDPGDVVDDVSVPVAFLPRTPTGNTDVPIGLQDPDQAGRPEPARGRRHRRLPDDDLAEPARRAIRSRASRPGSPSPTSKLTTRLSFAWVWQLVGTPLTSTNRAEVQATVEPERPTRPRRAGPRRGRRRAAQPRARARDVRDLGNASRRRTTTAARDRRRCAPRSPTRPGARCSRRRTYRSISRRSKPPVSPATSCTTLRTRHRHGRVGARRPARSAHRRARSGRCRRARDRRRSVRAADHRARDRGAARPARAHARAPVRRVRGRSRLLRGREQRVRRPAARGPGLTRRAGAAVPRGAVVASRSKRRRSRAASSSRHRRTGVPDPAARSHSCSTACATTPSSARPRSTATSPRSRPTRTTTAPRSSRRSRRSDRTHRPSPTSQLAAASRVVGVVPFTRGHRTIRASKQGEHAILDRAVVGPRSAGSRARARDDRRRGAAVPPLDLDDRSARSRSRRAPRGSRSRSATTPASRCACWCTW